MLTFGTTSRSLSKASLRPFIRFLSLALAMLRLCFMMVGVGGCRFFFRPPFPFFFVPIEELYASPWDSWEKNIFLQTSHNNNYRKLKYQHYTTSTLYMIISWFFLLPSFTCFSLSKYMVFVFVSMLQMSNVFPIAMWLFNQDSREWDVWGMMGI